MLGIGLVLGFGVLMAGETLLGFYSTDPYVITAGMVRMKIMCTTYFLCGLMEVVMGVLRGMGYSVMPMLVSLAGACLFRIVWLKTFFAWDPMITVLYWSYPISWALTCSVHSLCYLFARQHVSAVFHKGVRKQRHLENETYRGIRRPRTLHRLHRQ